MQVGFLPGSISKPSVKSAEMAESDPWRARGSFRHGVVLRSPLQRFLLSPRKVTPFLSSRDSGQIRHSGRGALLLAHRVRDSGLGGAAGASRSGGSPGDPESGDRSLARDLKSPET
jgi:hypothetical protein